jgi:mRNA-degrading endonuclease RelE of RelBE toxin-antitoxin system
MYEVEYTIEAIEDLKLYRKHERQLIVDQIDEQLSHEPSHETRNRKRLRPNSVAEFELRITQFRVFYDVDENKKVVRLKPSATKRAAVCSSEGRNISYENGKHLHKRENY